MSICILGFVFSLRSIFFGVLLAPTVFRVVSALSTVSTFNRIPVLVLALVLVLSVLSLLSLPSLCVCPCRACLCFVCPCLCQMHQCSLGRLLLGVMNLSVSRFVYFRDIYTHSSVLISSLKTPYEVNLARFNCTCFSRSSGNKASRELMRMSSARVCAFPWASRRLQ